MEEVKKNKKKNKVASLLLALALILTCGVAGTIAQYQKSLSGSSVASIAKFDVSATYTDNGGQQQTIEGATVPLFSTVKDTKDATGTPANEGDVVSTKIAPGTWGYFPVSLKNSSEVNVYYQVTASWDGSGTHQVSVDGAQKDIPLEFGLLTSATEPTQEQMKGTATTNITWGDINSINQTGVPTSTTPTLNTTNNTTATVYVCWRWPYKGSEAATPEADSDRIKLDNAIGEAMAGSNPLNPTVEVGVKFTQVD